MFGCFVLKFKDVCVRPSKRDCQEVSSLLGVGINQSEDGTKIFWPITFIQNDHSYERLDSISIILLYFTNKIEWPVLLYLIAFQGSTPHGTVMYYHIF